MSSEAEAYVENHSPYRATSYLIHYRMAVLSNETKGYTIYMGDANLAKRCRTSTKTLQRTREKMITDGYLALVTPAVGRDTAVYQMLFPGASDERLRSIGGHFDQVGGHSDTDRWTSGDPPPTNTTKGKPIKELVNGLDLEIELRLWKPYPRKVGKADAIKAIKTRLKTVEFADLAGAVSNYAHFMGGVEPKFIMHPKTFFGPGERFRDYLDGSDELRVEARKTWTERDIANEVERVWADMQSVFFGNLATHPIVKDLLELQTVTTYRRMLERELREIMRQKVIGAR